MATVIGEGGSGGAVAIAAANKVFMLEHAIYSVISPEGCAAILWHKSEKAADAAAAMKITAQDLLTLKVIDGIVQEPVGGAHRAPERAIQAAGDTMERALQELSAFPADELKRLRREKFLQIGHAPDGARHLISPWAVLAPSAAASASAKTSLAHQMLAYWVAGPRACANEWRATP